MERSLAPPNGIALTSLLISAFAIGTYGSVIALILGCVALRRIHRSNGAQDGRDLASCGIFVGCIGTAIFVIDLFA